MNKIQKILKELYQIGNKIEIEEILKFDMSEQEFNKIIKKLSNNKMEIIVNNEIYKIFDDGIEEINEKGFYITDDLRKYLAEISVYKSLTKEEEKELFERYKLGDKQAGEEIIKSTLKLVVSFAKKYNLIGSTSIDFMDLIQEGNLILYKALNKFDISKETRFSTYAAWWIRNRIERTVLEQSKPIKISSYAAENIKKIKRYKEKYFNINSVFPSNKQIMEQLEISEKEFQLFLRAEQNLNSLDMPLGESDSLSLYEITTRDEDVDIAEKVVSDMNAQYILEIVKEVLTDREIEILILRLGLIDNRKWTYASISEKLGITGERVRKIQKDALRKVKQRLLYQEKSKKYKGVIKK